MAVPCPEHEHSIPSSKEEEEKRLTVHITTTRASNLLTIHHVSSLKDYTLRSIRAGDAVGHGILLGVFDGREAAGAVEKDVLSILCLDQARSFDDTLVLSACIIEDIVWSADERNAVVVVYFLENDRCWLDWCDLALLATIVLDPEKVRTVLPQGPP